MPTTKRIAREPVAEVPAKRGRGRPRKVEAAQEKLPRAVGKATLRIPVAPAKAAVVKPKAAKGKHLTLVPKSESHVAPPRAGTKTAAIYKLLTRSKGCTRPEALEVTGWPSISMQQRAGQMGLKLRLEKTGGGITRYYGSP